MNANNLNLSLCNILELDDNEKKFTNDEIMEKMRIVNDLFFNGKNKNVQKLYDAFGDREVRTGLLDLCSLLKALDDNKESANDIYTILKRLKSMDIDRFIGFVRGFRLKTDTFFCVSSNREIVDPNKTKPALAIAGVEGVFCSKKSNILRFRDNTCKIGYVYNEQWAYPSGKDDLGSILRRAEHGLRRKQWDKAVLEQGHTTSDIREKIKEDFSGFKSIGNTEPNIKMHFLVRRLFREKRVKVFNIAFRGKSDDDTTDVDEDKYNIFSMLNYGFSYQKLQLFDYYGTIKCFLFESIRNGWKLNELGLRITERVLKLFLPENQYDVNLNNSHAYADTQIISVVKKNCKYSKAAGVFALHSPVDDDNDRYIRHTSKEYNTLDKLLRKLCTNYFRNVLPEEVNSFKQRLNSIEISDIISDIIKYINNDMGANLDKNDFVDMLSDVLYVRDSDIHAESGDLSSNRMVFSGSYSWYDSTVGPLDAVFKFIQRWLKKKSISINQIKNLPSNFFVYSSADDKTVFSPIHYIQALFASPLIVKKYHEADPDTRKIIIRNINYLRNGLVNADENSYNEVVRLLKTNMEIYKLNSQEAFAAIICQGMDFTTKYNNDSIPKGEEDDITNICKVAYDLVEFDLDNDMREHVTQLNFVELIKNEEGKTTAGKVSGGKLVVPMNAKRLFQEHEYNSDDDKEWEWNYKEDNDDNIENNNNNENQNKNGKNSGFGDNNHQESQNNFNNDFNNNNNNLDNDIHNNENNNREHENVDNENQNKNDKNSGFGDNNHQESQNNFNNDFNNNNNNLDNDIHNNNNQGQENDALIEEQIANRWIQSAGIVQSNQAALNLREVLKEYVRNEKIDNPDKSETRDYAWLPEFIQVYQNDLEKLREVLGLKNPNENVNDQEEIVKQWMIRANVQNVQNDDKIKIKIKEMLKEYIRKEKIDGLSEALGLDFDFVPGFIQLYQNDLKELRKFLGLENPNENVNDQNQNKNLGDNRFGDNDNQESQNGFNNDFNNNNNNLLVEQSEQNILGKDGDGIHNNLNLNNSNMFNGPNIQHDNNFNVEEQNNGDNLNHDDNGFMNNLQNEQDSSNKDVYNKNHDDDNDINNDNFNNNNSNENLNNNDNDENLEENKGKKENTIEVKEEKEDKNENEEKEAKVNENEDEVEVDKVKVIDDNINDNKNLKKEKKEKEEEIKDENKKENEEKNEEKEEEKKNKEKIINEEEKEENNNNLNNNEENKERENKGNKVKVEGEDNKENQSKVTVKYKGVYNDIKNSNYFCRNMCVLWVKQHKTYNLVTKYLGFWERTKVELYWIFAFPFIKNEFKNYNYEDSMARNTTKLISEMRESSNNLENSYNRNPDIPLQQKQREDLSNNKNEPGEH